MADPTFLPRAVALASTAHSGQLDKAGEPYILHPLRVMLRFESDILRAVCVLHDVVEDTKVTLEQIRSEFGAVVAGAVDAMSRRAGESYDDFITRCSQNELALLGKIADLEDNLDPRRIPRQLRTEADDRRDDKYRRALERLREVTFDLAAPSPQMAEWLLTSPTSRSEHA